ncbi:nuclear transport factor 2 family protein [Nonomuraea sp. NEAU-A123]|uniref:nuclear transport factor 2 family protein n=1 Tax=Nonomuraea sp. NEAU-A123 TaxID=2839649 RepID=UPI001BE46B11|nr:nuclear transport factor 2 family protein [Nonomuraea sp. NEAU-A123]MBT2225386.1 nuclear transport factor 2 family protein [Nonomuraea sp. NEAU-A123]
MDTRTAAQNFADTWQHGWTHHDADRIAALYSHDAVHTSMPFRPPHRGRGAITDYIRWSFSTETAPQVTFATPIVDGDQAVIEFRVHATDDGTPITLAGCVIARFDTDGLAVQTRDYWHTTNGHV